MALTKKQQREVSELKNAEIAAYTRKQLDELRKIYTKASKDLQRLLLSEDATTITKSRATVVLKQVLLMTKALEADVDEWAQTVIPLSYERGIEVAAKQIKRLGIAETVEKFAAVHTAAIAVIADSLAFTAIRASSEVNILSNGYIRRAQIDASLDAALTRQVAQGIIRGEGTRKAGSRLFQEHKKRVANAEFIQIGGKSYDLGKYLELVAQTRTREATTQGTLNTAVQYGMDLVIWDVHDNPCTKCQPFSGRVFSISGGHPDFPPLDKAPPVHPRCECTVHPTTEIKLNDVGLYDKLVAFSKNKKIPILTQGDYEAILGKSAMSIAKAEANVLGNLAEAMSL